MIFTKEQVLYDQVACPVVDVPVPPPDLPDAVYAMRLDRVRAAMAREQYDVLVFYADREHGANFGYLCGFEPRFEEACLVLFADGSACALLGNENLKMQQYSRLTMKGVHVPLFSLPNQPMEGDQPLWRAFAQAGVRPGMRCGVIGWKLLPDGVFDVPAMILDAVRECAGAAHVYTAARLMIDPGCGVRVTATAEEIAGYEYAASMASRGVWKVLEKVRPGLTERELAAELNSRGLPLSCYSMCATGERFSGAMVFPREKAVSLGDRFTTTMGLRGGLTCRAGYAAHREDELPAEARPWLESVVKPYFAASATWYSSVGVGVTGGEVYRAVDASFPKAVYGWKLNPGHLIADEEWLSSPFFPDSKVVLRSGMLLQMDIIPNVPGQAGVNAEDGVLLADAALRAALTERFPDLMARMLRRQAYMRRELGIPVGDDVLPLSSTAGYLRPFLLEHCMAMRIRG